MKPKSYVKFVKVREDGHKVLLKLDGDHQGLDEMLELFEEFLRGCGYSVEYGSIGINDEQD
jgi:hypothetical protein